MAGPGLWHSERSEGSTRGLGGSTGPLALLAHQSFSGAVLSTLSNKKLAIHLVVNHLVVKYGILVCPNNAQFQVVSGPSEEVVYM